ncbi:hypothetical protein AB1Y20_004890 [Prymnesium parvum]|uniref:Uncharacterized protein n=1 Tax=Prymnesium parvum TaxID=97485 RepID=A0AB34IY05_PRYPA
MAAEASPWAAAGTEALAGLTRSKLGLNGAALIIVGFFGALNLLSPPSAIVSAYALLFGVMLVAFSLGAGSEWMRTYFGFMFYPDGQCVFLLVAGNLAWSSGLLGCLVALLTNANALSSWWTQMEQPGAAARPSWLSFFSFARGNPPQTHPTAQASKAAGSVDPYLDPDIL